MFSQWLVIPVVEFQLLYDDVNELSLSLSLVQGEGVH